jgi:hypothetical protein
VRAGAGLEDDARVFGLGLAVERDGVVPDDGQQLVDQLAERHQLAARQVEQAAVGAEAHGAPAVLGDQHARIAAPCFVLASQPVQHAHHREVQRREAHGIVEVRAAIEHACLERRVARARPDVPPDLGGVLDEPVAHQRVEMAAELTVALEMFGQAGARQR